MELRKQVSAMRVCEDMTTEAISGEVRSIFISPDDRVMVQIKTADGKAYNVDALTVDASPEALSAYTAAMLEVDRVSKEGNAAVRALVEDYNNRVSEIYKGLENV